MQMRRARHNNSADAEFYSAVTKRVNEYFKVRHLTTKATAGTLAKVLFCLAMLFVLYGMILSNRFSGGVTLALTVAYGFASALVGFNISHDAIHGALFTSPRWNRFFGFSFDLIGLSSYAWFLKHNVVHHNHPNVSGIDFDIETGGDIMRLCPAAKRKSFHWFQHLYAPVPYMVYSLFLMFADDFIVVLKTKREFIDGKPHPLGGKLSLVISKAIYLLFMIVIPLLVLKFAWWQVLFGFLVVHFVISLSLALVIVPAHVFERVKYPGIDPRGEITMNWAVHQLAVTSDYARNSRICNFLFGGLNTHVAHHLFPHVCHTHYIAITEIIKQTAAEYGVTYYETSFWGALVSHFKTLKNLGRLEELPG